MKFSSDQSSVQSAVLRSPGIAMVALLAITSLATAADPRYIRELAQNGFLSAVDIKPPVVTLSAGARFLDLVPDSRRELCEIELDFFAKTKDEVTMVRIVDAAGNVLLTCGE